MSRATTSWSGTRRSFPTSIRRQILQRAPICQWPGCTQPSTEADHITPHAEGGLDTLDNGQALCSPHHQQKTRAEQARGQARRPRARRPSEPHPGITTP